VILYRKGSALRVRRMQAPEPPFYCATQVAPYGARKADPVGIDYLTMRSVTAERGEVAVAGDVRDELERARNLTPPVLVDATESAERVFRRAEDVLVHLTAADTPALHLIATRGVLPDAGAAKIVIAAWPLDLTRLENLFTQAAQRAVDWGVLVPLVYPLTTALEPLRLLADLAAAHGASFLASASVETDPVARQAVARALDLEPEDDRYAMLFHGSVEPIQLSTERHIAALAAARALPDRILLPDHDRRTNWNAAAWLTVTASRMLAMELDIELATSIARSARRIAALDKPLTRIAESASLAIIGGIDETAVAMLTEWLAGGTAEFANFVDAQWRLPRG
jgi:hypothetical protein